MGGHGPQLPRAIVDLDGNWSFDRDSGVAPPFPLHQRAHGTEAGLGTLGRKRLVKDKVGSQIGTARNSRLVAEDGYGYGTLVVGCGTPPSEPPSSRALI